MDTLFLIKKAEIYNEKKEASSTSGAGLSGCLHVENANRSISFILHKPQVHADRKPQHKTTYTDPDRREHGE